MSQWIILHNPKCSKSRQTLALLNAQGIKPSVREYLKDPLSSAEISDVLKKLGTEAVSLVRTKEAQWQELGLDPSDTQEVIAALVKYPALMERPVVITNDRAAIGRPPESVLDLI